MTIKSILISIFNHIPQRRKKQLVLLAILMLLTSLTEVVSIGAVLPFLSVLANPEAIFDHKLAQPLIQMLNLTEPRGLILPLTVMFALGALIAGLFRIILLWAQTKLAFAIGADMSIEIYRRTLYQPYAVHVKRNSSEIISGISSKAGAVVKTAILPIMTILGSFLMVSMIIVALITVNPTVAISAMFGFVLIYSVIAKFTSSFLLENSKEISEKNPLIIKALQEGLGGIRDVLIDGTQPAYCSIFRYADRSVRRASANNLVLSQSPRYGVEALGMVLIAGLAYSLGVREGDFSEALPILGVLAVGAQRMLPMLQQSYGAWASIRGSQAVLIDALDLIEQPLPKYALESTTNMIPFNRSIILKNCSFRYSIDAPYVLKHIDLTIMKGSKVGFIGTTGSGKSTLLDLVMGLIYPSEGSISIDGVEINDQSQRGWQSHIAHIPQTIFLSDATINENIAFGIPKRKIDQERVRQAAQQAQISETIESWGHQYETIVGERGVRLSGGQRQRIGIARALYKQSDVIIFDEATSALDNKTEKAVIESIDDIDKEITILIVAHRLTTLKNCDQVIEIESGKVVNSGTYAEVVSE